MVLNDIKLTGMNVKRNPGETEPIQCSLFRRRKKINTSYDT